MTTQKEHDIFIKRHSMHGLDHYVNKKAEVLVDECSKCEIAIECEYSHNPA